MKKVFLVLTMIMVVAISAAAKLNYSKDMENKAFLGDAQAMYELSVCYRFGYGIAVNKDKAGYWLERAAQEGQPLATVALDALNSNTGLSPDKRQKLEKIELQERERLLGNKENKNNTSISSGHSDKKKRNILSLKESIFDNDIQYPSYFNLTNDMLKEWYDKYHETNSPIEQSKDVQNYGIVSDEVYKKRLQSLPTSIEMPFNQIVKSYIEKYVVKGRSLVAQLLGMSPYYMPIFEAVLERYQMPLELKYLPITESGLNPNAVSPNSACGLWQLSVSTAKGLGLEVNSLVDERRDPYASSKKAVQYLKELYSTYHDWSLCIAAYNCGIGNVNKAIKRTGNNYADFWEIYNYLPKETRGYVPAFIAANYVMCYYKEHGITPIKTKPFVIDTIMVNKKVCFKQIAQAINIPIEEIKILNPQYLKEVIPGNVHPYVLALPSQYMYKFIMEESKNKKREIVKNDKFKNYDFRHSPMYTVKEGETLEDIAYKHGMTVQDLMLLNELKSNSVKPGKILYVLKKTDEVKEGGFSYYYKNTNNNHHGGYYNNKGRINDDYRSVSVPKRRIKDSNAEDSKEVEQTEN